MIYNNQLTSNLQKALGVLDIPIDSQLYQDAQSLINYLAHPNYRIAVFGPFNHGKSTLLNALLGNKTLPIDIIPTTGAVIQIKYGDSLKTIIKLTDGTQIEEPGTEILKQYAILDQQRRMRDNVSSVCVYSNHPFLQLGVELLDLPGTNDQEAQDSLVQKQLLNTDLIIQVLDARKLMTLGERENLRDWLTDRGINSIIFVVNFMNLLQPDEQKQVFNRLRFLSSNFRTNLPSGISNLYRVDALPALRARLKGDITLAQESGITTFESALQTIIIDPQSNQPQRIRSLTHITQQLQNLLNQQITQLENQINQSKTQQQEKIKLQQKAEQLIKQGLQSSISDYESWLYLPNLLNKYQTELANTLAQGTFSSWEQYRFRPEIVKYQQAIMDWVKKAKTIFEGITIEELSITLPPPPNINPTTTKNPPPTPEPINEVAPIAIATGLGWVFGGPVGAALAGGVSYLIQQSSAEENSEDIHSNTDYNQIAQDYLSQFSTQTESRLRSYHNYANQAITYPVQLSIDQSLSYKLQLMIQLAQDIDQEIQTFEKLL